METLTATRTNVQTVQEAFENFLQGDISAIIEVCKDDVEWGSYDNPDVPYASKYQGKTGVLEFFSNLGSTIDYTVFEPKEFISQGNDVVVFGRHAATVKKTGKKFDHDFCFRFTLSNCRVTRFFAYVDSRDQGQAFK